MAMRTTNLVADLTALKESRYFVMDWSHTRQAVIKHWNYLRQNWRQGIDRPADQDFGTGAEPTFLCVCNRTLPVYLSQVDHILSQKDIPTKIIFRRVLPPDSPGPIRQQLFVDIGEDERVISMDARYLVEYQINPAPEPVAPPHARFGSLSFGSPIGRYGVEPQTGIIVAWIWNDTTATEAKEIFEFKTYIHVPTAYTRLVHAGDDTFETSVKDLLINDLNNLQLLCGPCNTSKQEKSFHYYKGYYASILRGIE